MAYPVDTGHNWPVAEVVPSISIAYQYVINVCRDPTVGYSQLYRNKQTVNGKTYYDCSSLMNYAVVAGGWATPGYAPDSNAFTTFTMGAVLLGLGAQSIPVTDPWLPGDILVRNNSYGQHTEMVYEGRRTMGAHTDRYPFVDQVSISDYDTSPTTWDACYRLGDAIPYQWITGNRYLSMDEMQNNALVQYADMLSKGWSLSAIAGLLGNEQTESTINPGIWQNLDEGNYSLGYGLVQNTPATGITDWLTANGYALDDGYAQDIFIDLGLPSGQWIPTSQWPQTLEEYKVSALSPEDCASIWLHNYERAGVGVEPTRRAQARYWYDYLEAVGPLPPPIGPGKPIPDWYITKNQQLAFFTMQKRRKKHDTAGYYYII